MKYREMFLAGGVSVSIPIGGHSASASSLHDGVEAGGSVDADTDACELGQSLGKLSVHSITRYAHLLMILF